MRWSCDRTLGFMVGSPAMRLALRNSARYMSAEPPQNATRAMNGRQFVYHMQGLTKTYPGNRKVLENINLSFYPDAKIGVLGVNGSGKSTLLRIMAGIDKEFIGEGWVADGARVGYLEQEPQLDASLSVRENVMQGVAAKKALLDRYNEIAANYSDETADEMAQLQDEIDAKNLWELDSQVDLAMDALRCPSDDADVTTLSGGERRRVALCRLLLDQPDLLLLDEPTNHLDAESVHWLEGHLRDYPGAILIVTHDRYFLDNVTGWILELDRGRGIPYQGNYTAWLSQKQKRLEQEGREEAAHQRTLLREQEWIAASPRARQAKSKARYERYEDLLAKAAEKQTQAAQIVIPVAERLGQNVIDFTSLKKGFGDNLLIDDLSFKLPAGGIVGIIGPNGAGKTTLFRMITGQDKPDSGTIKIGESVQLGYVDQSRDTLDGKKNVWEEISGGLDQLQLGKREVNSARLRFGVQFQGRRSAEEGRPAFRRRTQSRAPRQDAEVRRQRAAARRADQRSRRRHPARAGGGAGGFRRLRRHHQPRPLVPRPHRHPHPRVRRREPRRVVRGQLPGLREGQDAPARHRLDHAEAHQVQEVQPVAAVQYLVVSGNLSGALPDGQRTVANGAMMSFEKPWTFGAPAIVRLADTIDLQDLKVRLQRPGCNAFAVEGLDEPGAGQAFVLGGHIMRDMEGFKPYAAAVPDVVRSFGGRFLARAGKVTPLAGAFVPERVVLIEFPTARDALAFYTSERYAPLLKIRLATTEARFRHPGAHRRPAGGGPPRRRGHLRQQG